MKKTGAYTALEAVLAAKHEDESDIKSLNFFWFVYNNVEVVYLGRFFGHTHPMNDENDEEEFGAWTFEEMLECKLDLTGKTISEMLSELDAVNVSIDQSDFRLHFEMYLPDDLKVAENCQMLCMAHNRAKRIR